MGVFGMHRTNLHSLHAKSSGKNRRIRALPNKAPWADGSLLPLGCPPSVDCVQLAAAVMPPACCGMDGNVGERNHVHPHQQAGRSDGTRGCRKAGRTRTSTTITTGTRMRRNSTSTTPTRWLPTLSLPLKMPHPLRSAVGCWGAGLRTQCLKGTCMQHAKPLSSLRFLL